MSNNLEKFDLILSYEAVISKASLLAFERGHEHIDLDTFMYVLFTDEKFYKTWEEANCRFSSKPKINKMLRHIESNLKKRDDTVNNTNFMPTITFKLEKFVKSLTTQSYLDNHKAVYLSSLVNELNKENDELAKFFTIEDETSEKPMFNNKEAFFQFCSNMNKEVSEKGHINIVNRNSEYSEIERGLLRKQKNSIIITSEPGVGKTALVQGFVSKILNNDIHDNLKNVIVYRLDLMKLLAGIKYHGVLEERLEIIFNYIRNQKNALLFIDEMHIIQGNNTNPNSTSEIINYLKTVIMEDNIKIIGCTTNSEYRRTLQKDDAFTRRFNHIKLKEPNAEETLEICLSTNKEYEEFYGIKIPTTVWKEAIELSTKYIKNRFNPDKTLDLVDSALSRKKITSDNKSLTLKDVQNEISIIAKIPLPRIEESEIKNIQRLENTLKSNIFGQDQAIDKVINSLYVSKAGLRDNEKTIMTMLFQGPTSSGKTETARILADTMAIPLKRYDLSAYQEKHTVSKLIGSPPGYVGFGDGNSGSGQLINDIEANPHCVLLMDEIEKAHPEVLNILLQIMDYGTLESSSGKKVYFDNVILILTTNLGSQASTKETIGFMKPVDAKKTKIDESVSMFLTPEFRARLDGVVHYNGLNDIVLEKIIDKQIGDLNSKLSKHDTTIKLTKNAKDAMVERVKKSNLGARNSQVLINDIIKSPLSKMVMDKKKGKLNIDVMFNEDFYLDIKE